MQSFVGHRELLRRYLRPQARRAALMAVWLLAGIGFQLLAPQLLSDFIDGARQGAAEGQLLGLAGLFLVVALFAQATNALAVYASESVGWTATNLLRSELAVHCLRLDLGFHHARTPGEMIERVDGDVTQLSTFFSQMVIRILGNVLLMAGILALLFREDWRVGVIYITFTMVALAALRRLHDVAVPHWKAARQAGAMLMGFLEERLAGTEDIRSSGATAYVLRRLAEVMREQVRRSRTAWLWGSSMWASTVILLAVGNALAFGLGAALLRAGVITLGTVYLFFHYTEMLRRPIEQITRQMQELQRASAAVGRIRELLAIEPVPRDGDRPLPAGPLGVAFDRVSFAYAPDDPVLREVSFTLDPGRVLGLLGRTGSGKSTIGRLLVRLYDPTSGVIRVDGVGGVIRVDGPRGVIRVQGGMGEADLRRVHLTDLHRRVGLVTQDVQLFRATVRDNLTFFDRSIPESRIREVLEILALGPWLARLPDGLETMLDPRAGVSAGEGQLLAFARVFFKDPGLVILDEASSRLDPATERLIDHAVDELLRGRTAIIIAHRLRTVQRADEILILDEGRVIEQGARETLARDEESRFAALLRMGLEEVLVDEGEASTLAGEAVS
ncbi:MAG TPA: ABC transporter ATP-binding protein [bacterium]|nr:ABC transporter ATP-binding protein [bacterium]